VDLCVLFSRDKSVISRHIKNIFKDGELDEKHVVAKNATTGPDGKKLSQITIIEDEDIKNLLRKRIDEQK